MNLKKIITVIILSALLTAQTAYAIVDTDTPDLSKENVFENNFQSQQPVHSGLSAVEKIFNGKDAQVSGNILHQVGYNQFSSAGAPANATGKYDATYKLSIGEKINIYSYGDSVDIMAMSGSNLLAPVVQTEVNSNGSIFVQGVGLVKAENRTIGAVEREINSIASRKYRNIKIKLTIPSGNEFSVFIYGEVNRPGKVYLGNNSSILDALSAAGGVKKTGTLRNIVYNKGSVDLYNSLFFGNDGGIIVKPNDKIFVGKIGQVVAIKNGVTVPGIYEIKPNETIENVVKFAGGLLATTQTSEVTMTSFDVSTGQKSARNIDWNNAKATKLVSGDTVEFKELYNNAENMVTIQGNIKHPATFAYFDGMRLSDILKGEDELLEETFINQAVIRRVSGKNNMVETIPVFLKEFFAGMNDPLLQPKDVITVYKNTSSMFVDVYGCINAPKHLTYINNMRLSDIMPNIKFIESDIDLDNEDTFKTANDGESVQIETGAENSNKIIPSERVAVEITSASGDTKVYYMYDIMINSDKIKSITIQPEDKIFFRTLRDNEIMKTVKISGFVKEPGVYSFVKGQNLVDMIKMAGGLDEEADLRGIRYRRTNLKNKQVDIAMKNNERDIRLLEGRIAAGYKQDAKDLQTKLDMIEIIKGETDDMVDKYTGQIALNIKVNDINKISDADNIEVQDGDDIYIPRIANHISVLGEVYNEQSFMYIKGANVRDYINQVGGYTPNANKFRIYKVGINGRAEKVRLATKVSAGDTIVVPRKIAGNDWIGPICQTLQGLASIFIMAFAINRW